MSRSIRMWAASAAAAFAAAGMPLAAASAQVLTLSPFLSYTNARNALSPTGAGAEGTLWLGVLGLRGGGSFVLNSNDRLDASTARGWDADADLVLRLATPSRYTGIALVPYGFVGAGARGRPGDSRTVSNNPYGGITYGTRSESVIVATDTRSYGGGVNVLLGPALELEGEARWRVLRDPQATGDWPWKSAGAPELRLGLGMRL